MTAWRAAASMAVALMLASSCGGRDEFEARTFAEVEQALVAEGLQICDTRSSDGHANQAVAGREYVVAIDCATGDDDQVTVVVDEFSDADHRDAAARNFEGQVRPRAYGAVWTFGPFVISASGPRDDAVEERVTDALDQVGAE
jgi:hypothetical protein